MPADDADLVAAYWKQHRLSQGGRAERLQAEAETASDTVRERISEDADLDLLDALLSADEADLVYLGSGPLEDLLLEHGAAVAGSVAERCVHSARWRKAVSAVWLDDREWAAVPQLHSWLPKRR